MSDAAVEPTIELGLWPEPAAAGQRPRGMPIREGLRPSAARAAAAARLVGADQGPAADPAHPTAPDGDQEGRGLRVVEPVKLTPAQRRRRTRALLVSAGTVIVSVALALVYFHVVLAQRQFALNRLDAAVQTQRATYERLRLQVAELGSPQHVISTAVGRLGMHQPASVEYLTPTAATAAATSSGKDAPSRPVPGSAPAGDADWPLIKSQLAGSP